MKSLIALVSTCLCMLVCLNGLEAQVKPAAVQPKEKNGTSLQLGLRLGAAWTVSKDSDFIAAADSGANANFGGSVHFFPVEQIALTTGGRYRYVGIGYGSSITFREWQIPAELTFYIPTGAGSFFLGGGVSYLMPTNGVIYKTLAGSPSVVLPSRDLTNGLGITAKMGIHRRLPEDRNYFRLEVGFEYCERPLKIITRDLYFAVEFGFILFYI